MKILKKRAIAFIIDCFVFGLLLTAIQPGFKFNMEIPKLFFFLMVIPFFIRDVFFRNASLGKKILGIAVYDEEWKAPKLSLLVKRSAVLTFIGYFMIYKAKFVDGSYISLFDYERDHFKTQVVDKKVLEKLKVQAKGEDGDFNKNLTRLYKEYLMDIYMK